MAAVALALGASLAWGLSDFLGGLKARQFAVLWVLLISQATGLVLIVVATLISGADLPSGHAALWAAGAGVAEVIGFAALYRALAVGAMSVVAPVSATAALVPVIVGVAAGQAPTAIQALGIALALGGAALASTEPGHRTAAGIGLAVVAALGFGLFFVGMDVAADDGALWATSINRIASLALVVAALLMLRPPCPIDRAALPPLAAVGALDIAANAMFAIALTLGMAAIVSVLGSLYPLATVVLARAVLGERVSGSQRTGVAAALAGIGLVSFA